MEAASALEAVEEGEAAELALDPDRTVAGAVVGEAAGAVEAAEAVAGVRKRSRPFARHSNAKSPGFGSRFSLPSLRWG
jgi:hypothetical protein